MRCLVNTRCYTVCALRDGSATALGAILTAVGITLLALTLLGSAIAPPLSLGIALLTIGAVLTLSFGISALYNTYSAHYHYRHFLNSLPKDPAPAAPEPRALGATTGASSPPPLGPVPEGYVRFALANTAEGAFVVPRQIISDNCRDMEGILQISDQTAADAHTIARLTLSAASLAALRNILENRPLCETTTHFSILRGKIGFFQLQSCKLKLEC